MIEYIENPLFGVALTVIVFAISGFIYKRIKSTIINPIIMSIIFIICFLNFFNIDFESYEKGGEIINFFLGPATVALSIPIYKKINLLGENLIPILVGIFIGSLAGIVSLVIMSKVFNIEDIIILSMIPKSTTSAIAVDISEQIKGNPSMTLAFVTVTGTFGNVFGSKILDFFKIKSKVAKGISLGTSSHVIGTAKAIELGEIEGVMSSLAIGIAGIVTVFLAPIIINLIL